MKYVLVLDVAKGKSMFMLSSDVGDVLLEATSIYHKAPERFFKEKNYHVIVFNPLIGKEITNTIR